MDSWPVVWWGWIWIFSKVAQTRACSQKVYFLIHIKPMSISAGLTLHGQYCTFILNAHKTPWDEQSSTNTLILPWSEHCTEPLLRHMTSVHRIKYDSYNSTGNLFMCCSPSRCNGFSTVKCVTIIAVLCFTFSILLWSRLVKGLWIIIKKTASFYFPPSCLHSVCALISLGRLRWLGSPLNVNMMYGNSFVSIWIITYFYR